MTDRAPTSLVWDGTDPAQGPVGAAIVAKVKLTGPGGVHVPDGIPVTFALGDQVATGLSLRGVAAAEMVLAGPLGPQSLTVSFPGSERQAPAVLTKPVTVTGGAAPQPRALAVDGKAGYPVRVSVAPDDPDADAVRLQVDLTDDGSWDVDVPVPAKAFEQRTTYDHVYPAAFEGRLRVRVTDRSGNVGEATAPVRIAPNRPLGALRLLRHEGRPVRGIALSRDGSTVLAQVEGADAGPLDPRPNVVLDRMTGAGEVVNVLPDGSVADGDSSAVMSDDGRWVAFATGPAADARIMLRDLRTRTTVLVSTDAEGRTVPGRHKALAVSDDGGTVLMVSEGRGFVPTPLPECADDAGTLPCEHLYLKDVASGAVTMLTRPEQVDTEEHGSRADMTPDGRWTVFEADGQVHLHDRTTGTTEVLPIGAGNRFDLSDDGRLLAFGTVAALVDGDDNGRDDQHLLDRATGAVTLVSPATDGTSPVQGVHAGTLSSCGALSAFSSTSPDLVAGDTDGRRDVFLRDARSGAVRRVSVEARSGTQSDADASPDVDVSGDGRWVLFSSDATNLVPGDVQGFRDAFLFDTGTSDPCGTPPPPAGSAPVAADATVTTPAGTPTAVVLSAVDADGDALTYAVVGRRTGRSPAPRRR